MANTSMSPAEVKATCDKLECSPSQRQGTSPYGGKPSTAIKGEATSGKEHTSEFTMRKMGRK